jgi:DUF1365 family protein
MKTWMRGTAHELSNKAILKYALLHPFDTALNSIPRITWQAALLYYKKKMGIFKRPSPISGATLIDRDASEGVTRII